ncbi:hypothetical protein PPUJ21368_33970 [Pseudomonas putida]|nr:hypothetical protein PPUJ21368_33970 [Pseudomonas putida]
MCRIHLQKEPEGCFAAHRRQASSNWGAQGWKAAQSCGSWLAGDGAQSGPDYSYSTTLGSHREMAGM